MALWYSVKKKVLEVFVHGLLSLLLSGCVHYLSDNEYNVSCFPHFQLYMCVWFGKKNVLAKVHPNWSYFLPYNTNLAPSTVASHMTVCLSGGNLQVKYLWFDIIDCFCTIDYIERILHLVSSVFMILAGF